jgi:hypothetical protein
MMIDDERGTIVECLAGKTEVLGGNQLQFNFVHHKYHMI